MGKGSKSGGCKSASHRLFKDRAKNRVDDLQVVFASLQSARKESRTVDAATLEEQVHQMLREWKAELNQPSPASSLQGGSLGSFSLDICRLLQRGEEEDDATSALATPKPEPDGQKVEDDAAFQEGGFSMNQGLLGEGFQLIDQCRGYLSGGHNMRVDNFGGVSQLDYNAFDLHHDFEQTLFTGFDGPWLLGEDAMSEVSGILPNICPPPSAFLGPKCSLWDCNRPALGLAWCQDYCSIPHVALALHEGPPGMAPVLRPGGIGVKDQVLFNALRAKAQGKHVGIPECGGAATTKSPWNAPELFNFTVLEGETIREWLFFDKPRRAFDSGNRKQRSLPDYNGRGWHESRKQVMNDFGGLKRSYYMDPQPMKNCEWHLYEYEIDKCEVCALYRLEFKLIDGKKNPKGKIANDSSVKDLQKQMGRLTAEFPSDTKTSAKGKMKGNLRVGVRNVHSARKQVAPARDGFDYGTAAPFDYLIDNLSGYYLT